MDFGAALTDMWRTVLLFVPKALGFIAILLIGYLVARLVRRTVGRLLDRFGFYRAVRRGGITRFLENSRYDASGLVALLAYYTVLLFTLQLAFGIWGPNPVSDLIAGVVAWLPRAIVAIVIVVVAAAIGSAVKDVIANALSSLSYGRLLANLAAIFIVGLGVIAALNQIGVATTVTTPVLIAVLATIGGILIVGVGGGMIQPMRQRWERWLSKAEDESAEVRERISAYAQARREAMEGEAADAPAAGSSPAAMTTYAPGKASVHANNRAYPATGFAPVARTAPLSDPRIDAAAETRADRLAEPSRADTTASRADAVEVPAPPPNQVPAPPPSQVPTARPSEAVSPRPDEGGAQ
jgi:Conserved TM helix